MLERAGETEAAPPGQIALGRAVYDAHCAACHGAELEGQPDWRTPLPSGRLPAPPHDASGHTWHHPDAVLFRIVRDGAAAVVGGGYESDMPCMLRASHFRRRFSGLPRNRRRSRRATPGSKRSPSCPTSASAR
jgi:hypothetical protein